MLVSEQKHFDLNSYYSKGRDLNYFIGLFTFFFLERLLVKGKSFNSWSYTLYKDYMISQIGILQEDAQFNS
jgi:hypothetical protein